MASQLETLAASLRAGARDGTAYERAAVELLIWHEGWLLRESFRRACVVTGNGTAFIRWEPARRFADQVLAGGTSAPHASSSEAAILDLAVALGEDRFRLASFGTAHRRMVAHEVAAAVGLADPKEWPISMVEDRVTAYLADVRKRWEVFGEADALSALLAAVEAMLGQHRRGRIVTLGALCSRHEAHRHFSITSAEAASIVACQECAATVYDSCAGCGPQMRLDSCPVRKAISAALLSKEAGDGG